MNECSDLTTCSSLGSYHGAALLPLGSPLIPTPFAGFDAVLPMRAYRLTKARTRSVNTQLAMYLAGIDARLPKSNELLVVFWGPIANLELAKRGIVVD